MMTNETRKLIDKLNNHVLKSIGLEHELRQTLRDADDTERTEIAYFMCDALMSHPDLPHNNKVTIGRIERYIAHSIMVADWHIKYDDLMNERDALNDVRKECYFIDDDYEDDDSCSP
jgi:hypothetical protein